MRIKSIVKMFNDNSVSIFGKKGRGKDLLMSNIVARRKGKYYICNVDYKVKRKTYIPLNFKKFELDLDYDKLVTGDISPYYFPYPEKADIYVSDAGIYFPSQYNNELNRKYRSFPTFMALSRQLGDCYVHTNTQALGRVWDKIREQSDTYILCNWCKVICGIVIQKITIYEKYESAESCVAPYKPPMVSGRDGRNLIKLQRCEYTNKHGVIKSRILIYRHKTKYDTRYFKTLLEGTENA